MNDYVCRDQIIESAEEEKTPKRNNFRRNLDVRLYRHDRSRITSEDIRSTHLTRHSSRRSAGRQATTDVSRLDSCKLLLISNYISQ